MMLKIFLVAFASALVILCFWALRGLMLMPIKIGRQTMPYLLLCIEGSEPALEQSLNGLLWLNDNGTLRCRIIIAAQNLDEETMFIARTMASEHSCITLLEDGELPQWIRKMNS